jgi:hypothetical protein
MRSGDWMLYLSAVERATSLFFFFGRTNYSRFLASGFETFVFEGRHQRRDYQNSDVY